MTNEQQMKEVTIHKNCYDLRFIGISILNTNWPSSRENLFITRANSRDTGHYNKKTPSYLAMFCTFQ